MKKLALLAVTALTLGTMSMAAPHQAQAQTNGAGGLMSIIVNDPSNPFWLAEGNIAAAEAKKLGYKTSVSASKGDTNTESNLIDTAITNHSVVSVNVVEIGV